MNWYKQAQRKNRLSELLKGLSMGAVIGLVGWLGFNSMADLQNNYIQNPQVLEQKIIEYKNTNPEQKVQQEQKEFSKFEPQAKGLENKLEEECYAHYAIEE